MQYPQKLAQAGFAGQPVEYAAGRLVLWSMSLDVSRGLAMLSDPAVKHIAVANPDHAPYGRAAKAMLEKRELWDELTPKIVFGESVGQTAQFVRTGNAEAGLVAMSLVVGPAERLGHFYEVPAGDYPALEQGAVVTKAGAAKPLAQAYVTFLKSGEARKIFGQYGFRLPK
jgi:molybdate transport system substrate-binding protein